MDILEFKDGQDLTFGDSILPKASNLLRTQLGSLEYAPEFGIDIDYFVNNSIEFQNSSFKAYIIQKMSQNLINVIEAIEVLNDLFENLTLTVDGSRENTGGFIK